MAKMLPKTMVEAKASALLVTLEDVEALDLVDTQVDTPLEAKAERLWEHTRRCAGKVPL